MHGWVGKRSRNDVEVTRVVAVGALSIRLAVNWLFVLRCFGLSRDSLANDSIVVVIAFAPAMATERANKLHC